MMCPYLKQDERCQEKDCAFWHERQQCCSVLSIAKSLDAVAEVSEGQRTLYIRKV